MDDTGSLRRLDALADGPGADLVGTTGEVADQVEDLVARRRDLAEDRGVLLAQAELLALGLGLLLRQTDEALLESNRKGDESVSRVVLVDPRLDLGKPLVLPSDEVALGKVDEVGDGLGREEGKTVDDLDL